MSGPDQLESALRVSLADAVAELPDDPALLLGTRRRRRARRLRLGAVAALAAVGLTSTGLVLVSRGKGTQRPDSLVLTEDGPAPPAGQQAVSFHGTQLFVPGNWRLNATRCGTPTENTVLLPGGTSETCHIPPVTGLTVVDLRLTSQPAGRQYAALATTPATIDGHEALRGHGTVADGAPTVDVLVVPDVDVVIAVTSPTAFGRALLDTVHVTPVDSVGCHDHVSSLTAHSSRPDGTDQQLLPDGAQRVVLCRYTNNWLMRSAELDDAARQSLAAALRQLPDHPQSDPSADCATEAKRGVIIRATYPSGPAVELIAHLSGCTWSVSSGRRTVGITLSLLREIQNAVGFDGSGDYTRLPDYTPPRLP
jgi:hypothetical protein